MAYNELTCGANLGNTGLQNCKENFGYWKRLILAPADSFIDTQENALLDATWETKINDDVAVRFYPLPENGLFEPEQEATVYEELMAGKKEFIREGKDRFTSSLINISLHNHKELRKHNGRSNLGVFILTSEGYILGYTDDGVKLYPLSLDEFRVEKRTIATGENIDRTKLYVSFSDSSQWNDRGAWVKPTAFNPITDLLGIKDVKLTVTNQTTSGATVRVVGFSDNIGVENLVLADFVLVTSAGAAVSITSVTEIGDGYYTLVFTALAGGHVLDLENQPAMTTKGYETLDSVTFTIS